MHQLAYGKLQSSMALHDRLQACSCIAPMQASPRLLAPSDFPAFALLHRGVTVGVHEVQSPVGGEKDKGKGNGKLFRLIISYLDVGIVANGGRASFVSGSLVVWLKACFAYRNMRQKRSVCIQNQNMIQEARSDELKDIKQVGRMSSL